MLDQLIIGDKFSNDDFGATVRERKISAPKKKSIKETVPFSNITYDFSKINGEIYWEERELEYVLEMIADTPEELEEQKTDLGSWLMNVFEEKLIDPFILDYYFLATFSGIDFEDEVEKCTVTVTFTAYPYKIANNPRVYNINLTTTAQTVQILNNSSHRITPTFKNTVPVTVTKGNTTFSFSTGETTNEEFMLETGTTMLSVKSTSGTGTLQIYFYEEVF